MSKNKPKFTPGPWSPARYIATENMINRLKCGPQAAICTDINKEKADELLVAICGDFNDEQSLADAHLIAAAPEMYEAAEQLIYRLEVCLDDLNQSGEAAFNADHEISILKTVLAKARGEL